MREFRLSLTELLFVTPKAFAGNPCTFRHGAEFGPSYFWMAHPSQATIGTCNHVLATNQPRIANQTVGDQLGMLHEVAKMTHHSGHQYLAIGKLDLFPDSPLMFMAGVRGLDREHTDI